MCSEHSSRPWEDSSVLSPALVELHLLKGRADAPGVFSVGCSRYWYISAHFLLPCRTLRKKLLLQLRTLRQGRLGKLLQAAQAGSSRAGFEPGIWHKSSPQTITLCYHSLYLLYVGHQTLSAFPPQLLLSSPALLLGISPLTLVPSFWKHSSLPLASVPPPASAWLPHRLSPLLYILCPTPAESQIRSMCTTLTFKACTVSAFLPLFTNVQFTKAVLQANGSKILMESLAFLRSQQKP